MKKKLFVFLSLMLSLFFFTACKHTHEATDEWLKDSTNHWYECAKCDEVLDKAVHTYGEWVVVTPATETAKGSRKHVCTVCNYEETEEIPMLDHTHSFGSEWLHDAQSHWHECACGEKSELANHTGGQATETEQAVCSVCGQPYGELAPHACSYNSEGVCSCGKTEPGKFDKNIDGDLNDWANDLENAVQTFGESGTGFGVMAYHKDGKGYFAVTIKTVEATPNAFEIFQGGLPVFNIHYKADGDYWHANPENTNNEKLIALYYSRSTEASLNVFVVEMIFDLSILQAEGNGNYKVNFAAAVGESSKASFSDSQPEYWVLYGKNAWDPSWVYELNTTTKLGHEHLTDSEMNCIICGENQKLKDIAIVLDGQTDEWNADILSKMLVAYDEEDRWIKQVGFTDGKYLYMFVSVSHRDPVGNLNIIIGSNHFGQIASGSVFTWTNVEEAYVREYKDSTDQFTVTDYEFVILLDKVRAHDASSVTEEGVRLGIDINFSSETSHKFAVNEGKLMWCIAGYNSWSVAHNFVYGPNGVNHNHDWDEETHSCKFCSEVMPEVKYDVVCDGDFSDWSSAIIDTASKTYGESGTGWEFMGYRKDTLVYFGVTIKTNGAVPVLFEFVDAAGTEYMMRYVDGQWNKMNGVLSLGSKTVDNVYTLEFVVDFSFVQPLASGDYLFGFDCNVPEASKASFAEDNAAYWVMFGRNAWNSPENLFTITTSGVTHNHSFVGEYQYDAQNHWKECPCGEKEVEAHRGGEATETTLAVCEVCNHAYGELPEHTHNYKYYYNETEHWQVCSCGEELAHEAHRGGEATETEQAICEVCGQPYGKTLGYSIKVDGKKDDWSNDVQLTALKGWHKDSEDRLRGLEYMAFMDNDYIYIFARTITLSNADKGYDIIFNKNGSLVSTGLWGTTLGENVVEYKANTNVALENGLYESTLEMVIDKAAYVNTLGNVFVNIWFTGCDDSFAPLSWWEEGKTTIWGLDERCPWWVDGNHARVTENGLIHAHDLNSDNLCGFCQEVITLPITVDGSSQDWSEAIMSTARTNGNLKGVAFTDSENVYLYIEVTQVGASEPNYLSVCGSNDNGLRGAKGDQFNLYFDAGTSALRPFCMGPWTGCGHNWCDCNNGYVKFAMNRTTNAESQLVICYELVISKQLIIKANDQVWLEVGIDSTVWDSGNSLTGWSYFQVGENGIM